MTPLPKLASPTLPLSGRVHHCRPPKSPEEPHRYNPHPQAKPLSSHHVGPLFPYPISLLKWFLKHLLCALQTSTMVLFSMFRKQAFQNDDDKPREYGIGVLTLLRGRIEGPGLGFMPQDDIE